MAQANGMVAGGGGGNAGAMGMGGGLGGGAGVPPDIGGEGLRGGGMMGAPVGAPGGMQGAPGGAPGGAPIAPGGGGAPGMGAAASASTPYIGKRGSKNKQQEEAEKTPPPKMIKLTKLEQKMFKALTSLNIPHELFAQYEVRVPGESRPYAIDFAYPKIGVGVEVDGAIWHERPDFQQRDLNRDHNLSNIGWRILRFNEEAIDEKIDAVSEVISKHIEEAAKQTKTAEENNKIIKQASSEEIWKNPQYEFCLTNGEIGCKRGHIPQGKILYIGNIVNE
jgi:very-short-patch-repair endonuclease